MLQYCQSDCKTAEFLTRQSAKEKTETQADASISTAAKRDVLLVWEEKYEHISLLYTWKWNIFILPCNSSPAGRQTQFSSFQTR